MGRRSSLVNAQWPGRSVGKNGRRLKGVTDGVTADSGGVSVVTLLDLDLFAIGSVEVEVTTFDVLLGVVPSATRVGGGEGNLDSGHNASSEDTVGALVTEEGSSEERANNDEDAWGNHLLEGGVGGD